MPTIGITERGDAALSYNEVLRKQHQFDGAILITKDPAKLLNAWRTQPLSIPTIIHCTITGMGHTLIEPNVPNVETSIEAYQKLRDIFHPQRLVLRIDPIISLRPILDNPLMLHLLKSFTCASARVRISFMDMYPHVLQRFENAGIRHKLPYQTFHRPLSERKQMLQQLQAITAPEIEVCGEPGLECSGCVSSKDLFYLGLQHNTTASNFQRMHCACASVKKEILDNRHPCLHNCLYCYWK